MSTIAGSKQGYADAVGSKAMFNYPTGIHVDRNGNIIITDQDNHKIRKIS